MYSEKRRVILAVYWYPFESSPSLQNLAYEIISTIDAKVCVDGRFIKNLPAMIEKNIIYTKTKKVDGEDVRNKTEKKIKNNKIKKMIGRIEFAKTILDIVGYTRGLYGYIKLIRGMPKKSIIISADKFALLPCIIAGRMPRFYYSLEANNFSSEKNILYKILNLIEALYLMIIKPRIITQSVKRGRILTKTSNDFIIIPVTSRRDKIMKHNKLRKILNISPDKIIVLMVGGIGYDQMGAEVIESLIKTSERYVLVLRSTTGKYSVEIEEIAKKFDDKIKLSRGELTLEESEDLIYSGGDIGLVTYRDLGENYRATAYSSGKLAAFMRAGIPCVLPNFPEFRELTEKIKIGVICKNIESIENCLEKILFEYEELAKNAHKAYDQIYKYDKYFGKITSEIEKYENSLH